jgi:hypothetical protein
MATKDQIKLVKASHRRIKDLLEGTGIEARVSYTSADDTLKIVFSKRYKRLGCALEFTRCTSLREVSAYSGIIEYIIREVTHEMGPKKTYYTSPEAFCAELDSLLFAYKCATGDSRMSRCIRVAGKDVHIVIHGQHRGYDFNTSDSKGGRYGIYPLPLDYEAADAYFVDLMDRCTRGGYSQWVAAGMPKRFNPVAATGTIRYADGRIEPITNWEFQGVQCTNTWIDEEHHPAQAATPDPTNWHRMFNTACPVGLLSNTLFGIPVVWADEAPTSPEPF